MFCWPLSCCGIQNKQGLAEMSNNRLKRRCKVASMRGCHVRLDSFKRHHPWSTKQWWQCTVFLWCVYSCFGKICVWVLLWFALDFPNLSFPNDHSTIILLDWILGYSSNTINSTLVQQRKPRSFDVCILCVGQSLRSKFQCPSLSIWLYRCAV